ncbi:MAG: glycosyltransferase, partial [Candidatus Lokiarchaeota archaeon]|nr:glycosyltransferase [Candidatus Lokiarchaeota archaeon]
LDKFGQRIEPWFKPNFSPELMWSMMYPTHAVYSRTIFEKAGKMRTGYEGSQDYDLCLRVMELTDKIHHIPWVLYSWRKVEGSTADNIKGKSYAIDAAKRAISGASERRGLKGKIANDFYPFVIEMESRKKNAIIEIIIPTKDNLKYLKRCINSILEKTRWIDYQIIIIDNNSRAEETLDYLDSLKNNPKFKVLKYKEEFNFSAINNFAASKSNADFLLFLNNDTKVITEGWLEKLVAWAEQKDIGAVGCKLLYPDRTVQHAGIILGVGGVANHAYYKMPEANQFYFNHLHAIKNYMAVTGACLMVEKKKFDEIGGFNTSLPHSYNDVELCLELYEKDYRNVYIPFVELIHYESKSRDPKVTPNEDVYMQKRWGKYIKNDPYYNPNLNKDLTKGPAFSLSSD